ncbi:1-deoxy-D-xylulose-5-phosphate reductoisomerase [Chitinivibrio alkaliphilus]|uniref:1-deoxy-D-xylulose 5-phosphate reductoisomerase n=1 Tax=Chitinivibrio alkaliphilus ACht1 TaxID=1313304 RepID=U7DA45_9BACT|nr:1-deoxy-D-xylulose-5-phosphate reductoisomerase [Chitinivibrio alkaliphilus]ERP38882.1 1-deoxy-D-xylulose 5-phosphate reductoisomerase [Chitinivibrio alkaliphilus ACht1]
MKKVLLLGSSGSIGTSTENCIRRNPEEYQLVGISVNRSIEKAIAQIDEFSPEALVIGEEQAYTAFPHQQYKQTNLYYGVEGLRQITRELDYDILVNALVGSVGFEPTLEALKRGKTVALANKESLVVGGELIEDVLATHGGILLPVDSEHSAISQCLNGEDPATIESMTITASGGPFRTLPQEEFSRITVENALKHPTWEMGAKITIDSSTLMNKGFEVMEAHHLFSIPYDKISVVVHPQSIIHSMVTFHDGSVMAQCGLPDMELPIQYALSYPQRLPMDTPRLNLATVGTLSFEKPDLDRFPCLQHCIDAGKTGGTLPTVLNAANEEAVTLFLEKRIAYTDIERIIGNELAAHTPAPLSSVDTLMSVDKETRTRIRRSYCGREA